MGLESIKVSPRVRIKLTKLVRILFEKEYFGFLDSAENYVDSIYATIEKIPELKHFKTKNHKWGHWYIRHISNKETTYYILFDKKENRYMVRNIITNHESTYKIILG